MDEAAGNNPRNDSAPDAETQKISPSELLNLLAAGAAGVTRELRGWQPPSVEALQQMLPQYEISAFIARGGMGAVYKGTQKTLKRPVAIKVLPPDIEDGDMQYAARFKHEAQAMARLSHPNIVAVFDAGETPQGLLYFVMEFIEGTDVAQLIASEGRLPPARALPIITAVCEALAFAHEEGIIHRDIKPSNIMLDKKGRVKVADFGLAKAVNLESTMLTGSNVAMGTPDFIAPEALIPGMAVDGRADVYAVGVMLYQMLTGKIPRGRFASPSQVVPKMGKGFDAIVDKAMQTDRDRRYSTATEMKRAVEKVAPRPFPQDGTSGNGSIKTAGSRPGLKPTTTLAAALAVLALAGGAYVLTRPGTEPEQQAPVSSSPNPPPSKSSLDFPPGQWVKVLTRAEDLRTEIPGVQGITWKEGWMASQSFVSIPMQGSFTNSGLRARFRRDSLKSGCGLQSRYNKRRNYQLSLSTVKGDQWTISCFDVETKRHRELASYSVGESMKPGEEFTLEFFAIGDLLVARLNGSLLGAVRDAELKAGSPTVGFAIPCRDIEILNLDGLPEAEALSLAGVDAAGKDLESLSAKPTAIKLWDMPEKINSLQKPNIRWENNAIHLTDKAGLPDGSIKQANVIVRAEVLMNAGSESAQIGGRVLRDGTGPKGYYNLALKPGLTAVKLVANTDVSTELRAWPLSRAYRTDEWLPLELRIVGDEITASAEGRVLGTVKDSSIKGTGGVMLYAAEDGWFRNVEYVPLDKPVASVSSSPHLPVSASSAEPAAIKLWDTPDKLPKQTGITWESNAVRLDKKALKAEVIQSGDMVFRASIRMAAGSLQPSIHARLQKQIPDDRYYRLAIAEDFAFIVLSAVLGNESTDSKNRLELKRWLLPGPTGPAEWLRLELRIVGDELTASANGKVLGVVHDSSITGLGGVQLYAAANGYFRDIEYVPLDKPVASVSSSPHLPVSASSAEPADAAAKTDAIWKSRWSKPGKLRAAGTDKLGNVYDLKAAEPYDDFVQVAAIDPGLSKGRSWAALRSQGDLVWSDGTVQSHQVGLKRIQASVYSIGPDGTMSSSDSQMTEPAMDVSTSVWPSLPSRPAITAYADANGVWKLSSSAYDSGLLERPDVTSPPEVVQVVVASQTVGVLRKDGSLRIWASKELDLPQRVSRGVVNALSMGDMWAVHKDDGTVLKFQMKTSATTGQPIPPTDEQITPQGSAVAITSGSYSVVSKGQDGRWSVSVPGIVEDTLAKLAMASNESFSVFRGFGKEGILWIEPVK